MEKARTSEEFLERLRKNVPEILEANVDLDLAILRMLRPQKKREGKTASKKRHKKS